MLITLLIEMLVVTSAIAIGLFVLSFLRKKRDRKAVQALVAKIKGGQEQRLVESRALLSSKFGLDEEQAVEQAAKIDSAERGFYQSMVTAYLQRDHTVIEQLDVKFMEVVESYRALAPTGVEDGGQEEIERLQGEAERLSAELKSTMETMGGVLNDYSSVLSGSTRTEEPGVELEPDPEVLEGLMAPAEDVVEEEEIAVEEEVVIEDESPDDEVAVESELIAEDGGIEEELAVEVGAVEDEAEKLEVSTAIMDEVDIPDYSGLDE